MSEFCGALTHAAGAVDGGRVVGSGVGRTIQALGLVHSRLVRAQRAVLARVHARVQERARVTGSCGRGQRSERWLIDHGISMSCTKNAM